MRKMISMTQYLLAGMAALLLLSVPSPAQDEYFIGEGDILDVSFWQEPDLNAQVRVGKDGRISLDIIGSLVAAGKTTDELQNEIVRNISRLNSNISQCTVRIAEYNFNYVYVVGQVNEAGKLSFEKIPDLWTILNEAGGITETGDLTRVTIVKGGAQAGQVQVVNVADAITHGRVDQLPAIDRETTIEVPRTPGSVPTTDLARGLDRKNTIYVMGSVNTPGPISYEEDLDLAEALTMAGGPSADADTRRTRLIIKDGAFAQTVTVDLEKYAVSGRPARYTMNREDMIYVPPRRPGFIQSNLGTIAAALGAVSTLVLVYNQLND